MSAIRYTAWALVAVMFAVLSFAYLARDGGKDLLEFAGARIGGPFELVRADGTAISDADLLGKPHALFFG